MSPTTSMCHLSLSVHTCVLPRGPLWRLCVTWMFRPILAFYPLSPMTSMCHLFFSAHIREHLESSILYPYYKHEKKLWAKIQDPRFTGHLGFWIQISLEAEGEISILNNVHKHPRLSIKHSEPHHDSLQCGMIHCGKLWRGMIHGRRLRRRRLQHGRL